MDSSENLPRLTLADEAEDRAEPPRLILRGDPLGDYLSALRRIDAVRNRDLRGLIAAVIREGRRFVATPAGERWQALLADSPLIRNGWLVWNISGLDFLLNSTDEDELTPSDLWQQITRQLAGLEVEPYLTRLMQDVARYEVQQRHCHGSGSSEAG